MFELVPTNMAEVEKKYEWSIKEGLELSKEAIVQSAVLENTQDMINGALEGAYWSIKWGVLDQKLNVLDVLGQPIATISPITDSFTADFTKNAAELLRIIDNQIHQIVKSH